MASTRKKPPAGSAAADETSPPSPDEAASPAGTSAADGSSTPKTSTSTGDSGTDLAALRQRVADLEREQRELPDRIAAARSQKDAEEWMALLERQDALPDELDQARRDLLWPQYKAAWQHAEGCHAAERKAEAKRDEAHAAWQELANAKPSAATHTARAEHDLEVAKARDAYEAAYAEWQEADRAMSAALLETDELGKAIERDTGERPSPPEWWEERLEDKHAAASKRAESAPQGPTGPPPMPTGSGAMGQPQDITRQPSGRHRDRGRVTRDSSYHWTDEQ